MSYNLNITYYTHARGLPFIGDYDLKPLQQLFSIDSNVNLPRDNYFLYRYFLAIAT